MAKKTKRGRSRDRKRVASEGPAKRGSRSRKTVAKSKKRSPSITPAKIKATAKKAAQEAAVAAGVAAVGTLMEELSSERKRSPGGKKTDNEKAR